MRGNQGWNPHIRKRVQTSKCKFCLSDFSSFPSRKQMFCSVTCARKYNKPLSLQRLPHPSGINHPKWLGDRISYRGLHKWVVKTLGQPTKCSNCNQDNLAGQQIHWANISHNYKRNVTDWVRLCSKCHKGYDLGKLNLTQQGF